MLKRNIKRRNMLYASLEILKYKILKNSTKNKNQRYEYIKKIRRREKYLRNRLKNVKNKFKKTLYRLGLVTLLGSSATVGVRLLTEGQAKQIEVEYDIENVINNSMQNSNVWKENLKVDISEEIKEKEKENEDQLESIKQEEEIYIENQEELYFEYVKRYEVETLTQEEIQTFSDYEDGVLTVGIGHTEKKGGKYKVGDKVTEKQVMKFWYDDTQKASNNLDNICEKLGIDLQTHQKHALIDYLYNTGCGEKNLERMESYLMAYKDGDEDKMWSIVNTKVFDKNGRFYSGLLSRRLVEHVLFLAKTEDEIIQIYSMSKEEIKEKYLPTYYPSELLIKIKGMAKSGQYSIKKIIKHVSAIEVAKNKEKEDSLIM